MTIPNDHEMALRKRALFVCSRNLKRSPTAERIFSRSQFLHARSRGLKSSANRRITSDDVAWADIIFVMETEHKQLLLERFPTQTAHRTIVVLDIPDDYEFMDPELVNLITLGVEGVLGERPQA
jgi:predicted protein tyrosine phosphatase